MSDVPITHEFTVDEGKWYRGKGSRDSRLVRFEDGEMCCLGFLGESLGIPRESMLGVLMPCYLVSRDAADRFPGLVEKAIDGGRNNTAAAIAISYTNDTPTLSDTERKDKLTKYFASIGVRVNFISGGAA